MKEKNPIKDIMNLLNRMNEIKQIDNEFILFNESNEIQTELNLFDEIPFYEAMKISLRTTGRKKNSDITYKDIYNVFEKLRYKKVLIDQESLHETQFENAKRKDDNGNEYWELEVANKDTGEIETITARTESEARQIIKRDGGHMLWTNNLDEFGRQMEQIQKVFSEKILDNNGTGKFGQIMEILLGKMPEQLSLNTDKSEAPDFGDQNNGTAIELKTLSNKNKIITLFSMNFRNLIDEIKRVLDLKLYGDVEKISFNKSLSSFKKNNNKEYIQTSLFENEQIGKSLFVPVVIGTIECSEGSGEIYMKEEISNDSIDISSYIEIKDLYIPIFDKKIKFDTIRERLKYKAPKIMLINGVFKPNEYFQMTDINMYVIKEDKLTNDNIKYLIENNTIKIEMRLGLKGERNAENNNFIYNKTNDNRGFVFRISKNSLLNLYDVKV